MALSCYIPIYLVFKAPNCFNPFSEGLSVKEVVSLE